MADRGVRRAPRGKNCSHVFTVTAPRVHRKSCKHTYAHFALLTQLNYMVFDC